MTFEIHTLFDDVCFVDLRNATDHVPQLMIIFVKHFRKCSCKFIFETKYHDIDVIILTSFLHMNFFS